MGNIFRLPSALPEIIRENPCESVSQNPFSAAPKTPHTFFLVSIVSVVQKNLCVLCAFAVKLFPLASMGITIPRPTGNLPALA
jgi:hypothetical protein